MLRVAVLVNPIAGVGGSLAMKGSDGHWQEALDKGAEPHAQERMARFVAAVEGDIEWVTVPGAMGVPGLPVIDFPDKPFGTTGSRDTQAAALALSQAVDPPVDLLCFAGGDGTAADIATAGLDVPCLGVPAGVKITSPVFAHDPEEAAWLVSHLDPGFETVDRDVTDLDEVAYREGRLDVRLFGAMRVPASPAVQGGKVPTTGDTPLEPLVEQALRDWDPDALHVIGAGSVCLALKKQFWGEPTLLGMDVVQGDHIVAADVDARRLQAAIDAHDGPVHLWLSIIGGQGMLIGRGTQMLTPDVLRRIGWANTHVIAPPEKLFGLRSLHIDTGDPALDAMAPKHLRVISGYNEWRLLRVGREG